MGQELTGLRVLVVEDEAIVAMMVEDVLEMNGVREVRRASNVAQALEVIDGEAIDGALLDVNLSGERVDPVADALAERGIPFLFVTGYGRAGVLKRHAGARIVTKPFDDRVLVRELSAALHAECRERS